MPLTVHENGLISIKLVLTWLLLWASQEKSPIGMLSISASLVQQPVAEGVDSNSIEQNFAQAEPIVAPAASIYKQADCGTIMSNVTNLLVKNPQYPEPIFSGSICEIVIERSNSSITKLKIKLKKLELFRPTMDGDCHQDRFAVYTDLNVAVTPILCGNHTGETMSVAFAPKQTSLVLSIITSDTDHDRYWLIEVDQET